MLPICIGAATMALGFGIRFAVHANPTKIGPYIMQTMVRPFHHLHQMSSTMCH